MPRPHHVNLDTPGFVPRQRSRLAGFIPLKSDMHSPECVCTGIPVLTAGIATAPCVLLASWSVFASHVVVEMAHDTC